jgi:hypothetical protein
MSSEVLAIAIENAMVADHRLKSTRTPLGIQGVTWGDTLQFGHYRLVTFNGDTSNPFLKRRSLKTSALMITDIPARAFFLLPTKIRKSSAKD